MFEIFIPKTYFEPAPKFLWEPLSVYTFLYKDKVSRECDCRNAGIFQRKGRKKAMQQYKSLLMRSHFTQCNGKYNFLILKENC